MFIITLTQTTAINQAQYKHITDIHKHTDISLIKNAKITQHTCM